MQPSEKHPESKVKIRFPDCDPFDHLNNSRYIDYFLNAREDHLLDYYNFDLARHTREKGIGWLVTQNSIAYFKPAATMETVTIQTRLLSYTERELLLESTMWNEDKTKLKALLWTKFTHFNFATKKSETHSQELNYLFRDVVYPLDQEVTFEERIKEMK